MGLSRNKVAVPEGAAGTPPFWRDGYKVEKQVRLNPVLLVRETVCKIQDDRGLLLIPKASLLHAVYLEIEKDEAERSKRRSLKPVL